MIFFDTGFLFALASKRDIHHQPVVEVFRDFKDLRLVDHLLTANHVIAETITLTRKIGHEKAARLGIREGLAVDSDFTHRFIARPGPKRG